MSINKYTLVQQFTGIIGSIEFAHSAYFYLYDAIATKNIYVSYPIATYLLFQVNALTLGPYWEWPIGVRDEAVHLKNQKL